MGARSASGSCAPSPPAARYSRAIQPGTCSPVMWPQAPSGLVSQTVTHCPFTRPPMTAPSLLGSLRTRRLRAVTQPTTGVGACVGKDRTVAVGGGSSSGGTVGTAVDGVVNAHALSSRLATNGIGMSLARISPPGRSHQGCSSSGPCGGPANVTSYCRALLRPRPLPIHCLSLRHALTAPGHVSWTSPAGHAPRCYLGWTNRHLCRGGAVLRPLVSRP